MAGLPSFNISLGSILSAINGNSIISFLAGTTSPPYGIYLASDDTDSDNVVDSLESVIKSNVNQKIINFNSVLSFEISGPANITTAPVASINGLAGTYSSVNKVNLPNTIKMRVAVEGLTAFTGYFSRSIFTNSLSRIPGANNFLQEKHSRTEVINTLEDMKKNANLYNIETPDKVYPNYDLLNFSFVMTAKTGPTLLAIDLLFQEVQTLKSISDFTNSNITSTTQQVSDSLIPTRIF